MAAGIDAGPAPEESAVHELGPAEASRRIIIYCWFAVANVHALKSAASPSDRQRLPDALLGVRPQVGDEQAKASTWKMKKWISPMTG